MKKQGADCVGYIQLQFFDQSTNQVVSLGGAGFFTAAEDDAAWLNIPVFEGESAFAADRLNKDLDIVDEKQVSAETCEKMLGRSIADLISEGRARLKDYLDDLPSVTRA